jgi:hypothetical protein
MIEVESWPLAGTPAGSALARMALPCSRVSRDLLSDPQVTAKLANLEWWVGYEPAHQLPESWTIMGLKAGGEAIFGSGIDLDRPEFALTVRLAEAVQDHLTGYEYIQWPECPRHHKIMLPDVYESEAWWTCKGPNGHRVRIGDFAISEQ